MWYSAVACECEPVIIIIIEIIHKVHKYICC